MSKRLVSYRFSEDTLKEIQFLADVYTNGNSTKLLERLVRRIYFLYPLAMFGKYHSGFGVDARFRGALIKAWALFFDGVFENKHF